MLVIIKQYMNKNKLTNILTSIFQKESMWGHIFSSFLDQFNKKHKMITS